MNEILTKVAWKCRNCGVVTYHPSAKEGDPKVQIRGDNTLLEVFAKKEVNDGVRESKSYC